MNNQYCLEIVYRLVNLYSLLPGYSIGYFSRSATREVLKTTGGLLIFLQYLAYKGWISVQWRQIEKDAVEAVDQDGDGKFDFKDVKILFSKFIQAIGRGLPDMVGFSSAFYYGYNSTL